MLKLSGRFIMLAMSVGLLTISSTASADNPFSENKVSFSQASSVTADASSAAVKTDAGFPCQGNVNCRWRLNVRTGPWGKIIDGYAPGTRVEVVRREGDWYIIRKGSGLAWVHVSLIDIPGTPARGGPNSSPYRDANKKDSNKNDNTEKQTADKKSGGINGPSIPDCLLQGLAAAKKTQWFTTKDKCLQFAGTVAARAGAHVSAGNSIYPHNAYKPDKSLRGSRISSLDDAALAGKLKPGMLIHVKAAYDKDPAYNPVENAHHWFVYMGTKNGTPMFADCLRDGRLQTIQEIDRNMSAGRILKEKYKPYGNIRRVSAIYDPFADQR